MELCNFITYRYYVVCNYQYWSA